MNPRAFCREKTYETALLLTYSFDPLFFERVVLRDLWAGGTNECLVVADPRVLDEMSPRVVGQVHFLGRRYRLTTPLGDGTQHAKLILRAGPAGALVWVGSGNLTSGGWGNNKELATAWRIVPSDEQAVTLFSTLLAGIIPLLHGAAEQVGQRLLDLPWVSTLSQYTSSGQALLLSQPGFPLAAQLAQRWEGRKFHTVRILTGSTDRRGACLDWAARTFGVKKAIVGLDPDSSDFVPSQLSKLPLNVRLVPLKGSPRPHAKFYLFEGKQDVAAVVGSANCSAAAWLASVESGGNTELVVIYDHCQRDDFASALSLFDDGTESAPGDVLEVTGRPNHEEEPSEDEVSVRVLGFAASHAMGELRLSIGPGQITIADVEAHFGDLRSPLYACTGEGNVFTGKYPDLPQTRGTRFARIVFELDDGRVYETIRWLDEEDELAQSSVRHRISSIERLGGPARPSEQRQIIEDISEVARTLFVTGEFPDPGFGSDKPEKEEDEDHPAVDPHELVRSLEQIPERHLGLQPKKSSAGLPLHGIMRILFRTSRYLDEEAVEEEDLEQAVNLGNQKDDEEVSRKRLNRGEEPTESLKRRLAKTMENFLDKEVQPEFLLECTATQLTQATAFPLAVAARGLDGGWIDIRTALSWSVRILDSLFNTQIRDAEGRSHCGALALLEQRYRNEQRSSTLNKVLGNGLLWTALVADFTQLEWDKADLFLARALYLRDLFDTPVLYQQTDAETVRAYRGRGNLQELLAGAERTARQVKALEKILCEEFDALCQKQKGMKHKRGDLVYNPKAGFGWAEDTASITSGAKIHIYLRRKGDVGKFRSDWYCNVRLAAQASDETTALLLDILRDH